VEEALYREIARQARCSTRRPRRAATMHYDPVRARPGVMRLIGKRDDYRYSPIPTLGRW